LSSHDDDPAAPATAKLGQAVAVLAGTAEAFAQLAGVTWLHPSPRGCPGPTARRCVRRAAVTRSAGRRRAGPAAGHGQRPGAGPTTRRRRPPGERRRSAWASCARRRCATPGGCSTGNQPGSPPSLLPTVQRSPGPAGTSPTSNYAGPGCSASPGPWTESSWPPGAEPLAWQRFPGPLVVDVAAGAVIVAAEGAGQAPAANLTPTRPLVR